MADKIKKLEVEKRVEGFFSNIQERNSEEVKKIKRIVMGQNMPLKEKRKTFCKKCLNPYKNPKTRIKKGIKSVTCEKCGFVARWKINSS